MSRRGAIKFDDSYITACKNEALALLDKPIYFNESITVRRGIKATEFYHQLLDDFGTQPLQMGILTGYASQPFSFIFAYKHNNGILIIDPTGRFNTEDFPISHKHHLYTHLIEFYWQAELTILDKPGKLTTESGKFCLMLAMLLSHVTSEQLTMCFDDRHTINLTQIIDYAIEADPLLLELGQSLKNCIRTYHYEKIKDYKKCLGEYQKLHHTKTQSTLPAAKIAAVLTTPSPEEMSGIASTPASTCVHWSPDTSKQRTAAKRSSLNDNTGEPTPKHVHRMQRDAPSTHQHNLDNYIRTLYRQVTQTEPSEEQYLKLQSACINFCDKHNFTIERLIKVTCKDMRSYQTNLFEDFKDWESIFSPTHSQLFKSESPNWKQWAHTISHISHYFIPGDYYHYNTHRLYQLIDIGRRARIKFATEGVLTIGLVVPIEAILKMIVSIDIENANRQQRIYGHTSNFCNLQYNIYCHIKHHIDKQQLMLEPDALNLKDIERLCQHWYSAASAIDTNLKHAMRKTYTMLSLNG